MKEILTSTGRIARLARKKVKKWSGKISYLTQRILRKSVLRNIKFDAGVTLWSFSSFASYARVRNAHQKEPLTQSWIKGFKPTEVFWDVGANVGVFAFLAASFGVRCVSVEPAPQNQHFSPTSSSADLA